MSEQYRALDWLTRRRAGESCALIGERAGVSADVVRRATRQYGPFPRASEQLGRSRLSVDVLSARERRWVKARRRGLLAADIARTEGVRHQSVSRATRDHGPFPAPEVVRSWADARRSGSTIGAIAQAAGVRVATVRSETSRHGPFRPPGPRLPTSVEGVESIARRVGVSPVTVGRWRDRGKLPNPDFTTARGRSLWLPRTIDAWLSHADLGVCPDCGARCISVGQHRAQSHRARRA